MVSGTAVVRTDSLREKSFTVCTVSLPENEVRIKATGAGWVYSVLPEKSEWDMCSPLTAPVHGYTVINDEPPNK